MCFYESQQNTEPFCLRLLYKNVNHVSCILYLDLHIYKLKGNMTCLILQNVSQLPCVTVGNIRLICETRKQTKKPDNQNLPGSPVIKSPPCTAESVGLISGELGSCMPWGMAKTLKN